MRRLILVFPLFCAVCVAAVLSSASSCDAAGPGGRIGHGGGWQVGSARPGSRSHRGYGYTWGWGGGHDSWASLYRMGHIPIPPYFALHPPVYYSQPVARPYGYSPHAYPGWVQTPEIVEPSPEPIVNPYVTPPAEPKLAPPAELNLAPPAEETSVKTASVPQVTYNPFATSRPARTEKLAQVLSP